MGKDVTFVAESYKPAREDHSPLPKLDECIGLLSSVGNAWSAGPFIESAQDLHELASQQDERAPQYEGDDIKKEMRARTG